MRGRLDRRQAGVPRTRSSFRSRLAEAIDALQPRQLVIENERGLRSVSAIRRKMQGATDDERNPAILPQPGRSGPRNVESERRRGPTASC